MVKTLFFVVLFSADLGIFSEGEPLWKVPSFLSTFQTYRKQRRGNCIRVWNRTPFLGVTKPSGHPDLWLRPLYKVYAFVLFVLQRSLKGSKVTIALPSIFLGEGTSPALCPTAQVSVPVCTYDTPHNWDKPSSRITEWKNFLWQFSS